MLFRSNDTATTEIYTSSYTLSLHDALPIFALGTKRAPVTVISVTGELPPAERERRVADLTATDGAHVLVATDCLSEGVNLQHHFDAVVHYDLAWNPSRHDQREGRVDRYGQKRDVVRVITLYGSDNGSDRKSTRLNSSHTMTSRMPSSA